jgi:hypothetical protein
VEKTERILAAVLGSAVVLSGVPVVLSGAAARVPTASAPGDSAPAGATLQTIDLGPAAGTLPTGRGFQAPRAGTVAAPAVAPRTTGRFTMIGATWADPRRALGDVVEVRTRRAADGRWSAWQHLESHGAAPVEPGSGDARAARGSTDPLWVGESDGVQARIAAGAGRPARLPAGLRMDLVNPGDPGRPAARSAPPTDEPSPSTSPSLSPMPSLSLSPSPSADEDGDGDEDGGEDGDEIAVPARPAPVVVSRAGWNANEAIVRDEPEYSEDVRVIFVHHTAGTNSYSCAQSAAIIRGIQAYHVRSNHWDDIGYNFLVDKCGTLFEGRAGGVGRPVLGAHTLGFNTHSSAIAVLGNYSGRGVPARVRRVIAQVAAYKLGADGPARAGQVAMLSSGSDRYPRGRTALLNRISGHRDTGRTACPGTALYRQLGAIRTLTNTGPSGLALTKVNGATRVGGTYRTRGTIRPFWQLGTPVTMMHRFDVFVDDVLTASAARADRQQLLKLSPGRHTVRVQAVALNGRTSQTSAAVLVDQDHGMRATDRDRGRGPAGPDRRAR